MREARRAISQYTGRPPREVPVQEFVGGNVRVGSGQEVHARSLKHPGETACGLGGFYGGPLRPTSAEVTCVGCLPRRAS